MKKKTRILLVSLALLLVLSLVATGCPAPVEPVPVLPYPTETITLVVPWAVGGGADRWARAMSTAAIDHFGQAWHVVNMPGASALVGTRHMLDQPADGYVMIIACPSPVIARVKEGEPPLDIKIVSIISWGRSILISKPDTPWVTWEEFRTYVEANPGEITVGGVEILRLAAKFMFEQVGIVDKVTFVPYASTADAVADFLGGHIDTALVTVSTAIPLIPEDAVVVVNTSDIPVVGVPGFEGVPTATDLGFEGLGFPRYIAVHPDTPDEIADFISERMGKLLEDPAVVALLGRLGEVIYFMPRAEAAAAFEEVVEAVKVVLEE